MLIASLSIFIYSEHSYAKEPWRFFSLHGFDHLDQLDKQAEPAYQCGVSVLYATGLGVCGYMGIPPEEEWEKTKKEVREYVNHAKSLGIPVVLGYLCSTSIVGLKTFDQHWFDDFKQQFSSAPKDWLQQDIHGNSLPSWYGGEYNPACMNNPDWRAYQRFMVKTSLELGLDGIFFDNPTVHPDGCYCRFCMEKFSKYLERNGEKIEDTSIPALRKLAQYKSVEFKKFRATIARDFLEEMRNVAKQINPSAVITANNSLNAPEVIFSQCHRYGYNLQEMSRSQDFVVIEDMQSAPRRTANGIFVECSPVYHLVHSIIGSKPLVAVTIADGNYHTPPNLTTLAIFEAFTRNTNYMLWPTWEGSHRDKMIKIIRPFVLWLQKHAPAISSAKNRYDVLLYLPFEQWIKQQECKELQIARKLTQSNILYTVASEENFNDYFPHASIILATDPTYIIPSHSISISELCQKNNKVFINASDDSYMRELQTYLSNPSLKLTPSESLRGVIKETAEVTYLLLYNLNIERISSYEDQIHPANNINVSVKILRNMIKKVVVSTPEEEYEASPMISNEDYITLAIKELQVAGIVIIF